MNKYSKIFDFLNGELDPESEDEIFFNLHNDYEYRAKFKQALAVEKTIASNLTVSTPSTKLNAMVFSSLGYTKLTTYQNFMINYPAFEKAGRFLTTFKQGIISGITAASLTAIVLFIIYESGMIDTQPNEFLINTATREINELQTNNPKHNNPEILRKNSISKNGILKNQFTKFVAENNTGINENKINNIRPKEIEKSLIIKHKNPLPNNDHVNTLIIDDNSQRLSSDINQSGKDLGLSFEIKSSANWNFPKETISPVSYNNFNNMELSLFYDIYNNFNIGLDLKQETFYLEYTGKELTNLEYKYSQQPNYTTLSLNLRYFLLDINSISPFAQIGIGINKGGYVLKPTFGLAYQAYPDLSFLIGFVYNRFWYNHQNAWFNTTKLGLNYGVSYKF